MPDDPREQRDRRRLHRPPRHPRRRARHLRRDVPARVDPAGPRDDPGEPRRPPGRRDRRAALPPAPGRLLVRPVRHAPASCCTTCAPARPPTARRSTLDLGARADGTHDHRGVFIPPGVAHGFASLTDMTITYLVDGYYNPTDELGVAWDDPEIAADWGRRPTHALSDRDQQQPRPCEHRAALQPRVAAAHLRQRMRILVTGGAGFIGSNYVRHVLATHRRRSHRLRRAHLRGQPLDAARRRRRPALPVREGQHLRPGDARGSDGRSRRRRPLRGREPRRPVDRRPRRLHQHQLLRHEHRDGHRAAARDRPRRAHRHRRGVRLGRGRLVEGDRPARAALAVLRVEGRLRPDRALVPPHLRAAGHRHALHEQLRPVPVSRRRRSRSSPRTCSTASGSRCTATASTSATGSTSTTTARACSSCSHDGAPGEIYNIGAGNETPNRVLVDKLLALLGKGEEIGRVRRPTGSATTAATRSTSPRSPRSAGASSARSTRRSRRRSTGTATTAGGGSRSRPAHEDARHRRRRPGRPRGRRRCSRDDDVVAVDHATLDITDARRGPRARRRNSTRRDRALRGVDRGRRVRIGPRPRVPASTRSASATSPRPRARVGAYVATISTDYVFDGTKLEPYDERDAPNPQSVVRAARSSRASSRSTPTARSCARRGSCGRLRRRTW